ncbi:hypothetical protein [Vibrio ziniensis]|uniref:Flagellar sheath protein A n=1 Tax=Vibrio ziniensis TaxID=2711221 RepID=A0A6G7CH31_9VIBR|nr:hypothetical protein [Vibrio ziniensis]QIH41346.1 hypothetical protein G5S32_04785 [Vibrio ziniensis]
MLVGCGGGGGGSGSSSVKKTQYNFSFYSSTTINQSQTSNAAYAKCVIYKTGTDSNGDAAYTVYTPASTSQTNNDTVLGFYSNASGERVSDYISVSSGSLSFYIDDIPDNGFFTFQVVNEVGGSTIKAMSFSKEFLQQDSSFRTGKFGINRTSDSATSCVTSDNKRTTKTDSSTQYESNSAYPGGAMNYNFYSQIDSILNTPYQTLSSTRTLDSYSDENTFIVQYTDSARSEISQYGFSNWTVSSQAIEMALADQDTGTITLNTNMSLSDIPIEIISGNYAYSLLDRSTTSLTFMHPAELTDETWVFEVSDVDLPTNANWSATYSSAVDTTSSQWDLVVDDASLYTVTNLQDQKPTVLTGDVIDLSGAIPLQSEIGMQRIAYRSNTSSVGTTYNVTHVLYSMLTEEVVAPELYYYDYSSSVIDALKVSDSSAFSLSHLILEDIDDVSSSEFMSLFAVGSSNDLDAEITGLVVSEQQAEVNQVQLKKVKSLMLSRLDD